MRNWTEEEIQKLIESEKLALQGAKKMNMFTLAKADQLNKELCAAQDLYIMAYHNEHSQWINKGSMTFNDYFQMIAYAPATWACHPVNFKTLKEFDELATGQYN